MSKTGDLVKAEGGLLAPFGSMAAAITAAEKTLIKSELGFVLVDATANAVTITLPAADAPLDVVIRRVDGGSNRLVVQAAGADKIKFHTHLNADGYPFFVLMGAGDFWHLRSDGAGGWWPIARLDGTALGRQCFDTSTAFSPGGYGSANGDLQNRADWPWLWDHAQQSGMLTTEAARVGMEGGWTGGNGTTTFRRPDVRAEFIRALDEGRANDPGRVAGSWQIYQLQSHTHGLSNSGQVMSTGGTGNSLTGAAAGSALNPAVTIAATGGTETRPRNIAYPARIKMI